MFVPESEWHERDVTRSSREEVFTLGERGVTDEARPYRISKTVFRSKNRVNILIVSPLGLGTMLYF